MRICLVGLEHLPIPPRKGGAIEKGIVEVSKRFAEKHGVSVLALGGNGYPAHECISGVEYYREASIPLANSTLGKYLFFNNLFKRLRQIEPDIIHLHIRPTLTFLTKLYTDAPNVVSVHSYLGGFRMSGHPLSILEDRLIRLGFRSCAAVMPCSNFVGSWLNRHMDIEKSKIKVVYRGVDEKKFEYNQRLAERIRERCDLGSKRVVAYVGRIIPEKGVHILLGALRLLRKDFEDLVGFIIGPTGEFGTERCGEYASRLMTTYGRDGVYFLGELSEGDLIPFLCACDVFVYPSIWHEPFGIAVIEAMACERPVVASRVGGIPEIIEDGRTGLLTEPNSASALAKAMTQFFKDSDWARDVGKAARQKVLKEFTWDKVASDLLKVYSHVVRV